MAANDIDVVTHMVGGLTTHCYSHISARNSNKPVVLCFMLHTRLGSYEEVDPKARLLIREVYQRSSREDELYIVSFDHRNHGERLLDLQRNRTWIEGNDLHGIDMYTMTYGAVQDVTMLIEFLPSYMFPNGREIKRFALVGISMGGHAAWLALAKEPRISLCCVIIGAPAYLKLVSERAESSGVPHAPPYFPAGFESAVKRTSAESVPYASKGPENPFLGKRILVQAGGIDKLVPWSATAEFFDHLEVGEKLGGKKEHKIYPNVAHDSPDEMIRDSAEFIAHNM